MPFVESKVPEGHARDYFYSGRTGEPITDEEWDEQKQRLLDAGYAASELPWYDHASDEKEGTDG